MIIGANKIPQLEDNLKAVEVRLPAEEAVRLAAVTQPRKLYPEWMVERQNSRWR